MFCTFSKLKDFSKVGDSNFDKYYIHKVAKKVVKKTGTGEDDFVLVTKFVENKIDIVESINAQAGDSGIQAYIKPFIQTGEPIPGVKVDYDKPVNDTTGCPETLADAQLLGDNARASFNRLDPDLTKGMSYEDFLAGFNQKMFDDYVASIIDKNKKKEEK